MCIRKIVIILVDLKRGQCSILIRTSATILSDFRKVYSSVFIVFSFCKWASLRDYLQLVIHDYIYISLSLTLSNNICASTVVRDYNMIALYHKFKYVEKSFSDSPDHQTSGYHIQRSTFQNMSFVVNSNYLNSCLYILRIFKSICSRGLKKSWVTYFIIIIGFFACLMNIAAT